MCLIPLFILHKVTISPLVRVEDTKKGGASTTILCLNLLHIIFSCKRQKESVIDLGFEMDRSIQNLLILQYFIIPYR